MGAEPVESLAGRIRYWSLPRRASWREALISSIVNGFVRRGWRHFNELPDFEVGGFVRWNLNDCRAVGTVLDHPCHASRVRRAARDRQDAGCVYFVYGVDWFRHESSSRRNAAQRCLGSG